MKSPSVTLSSLGSAALATGILIGVLGAGPLVAQVQAPDSHNHDQTAPDATAPSAPQPPMKMMQMPNMSNMMEKMEKMKAANAKFDTLVANMNAATGDKKVEAMATLLTALVQEHGTMRMEMGACQMMMQGMSGTSDDTMMDMMMKMKNMGR